MILRDGTLQFKLQSGDKEIAGSIDLFVLRLAVDELLQVVPLDTEMEGDHEVYIMTAEFLAALPKKLTPFCTFSEPAELTPTQAQVLWARSKGVADAVKKNTPQTPNSDSGTDSTTSDPPTPTGAADLPTGPQTPASTPNDAPGCC